MRIELSGSSQPERARLRGRALTAVWALCLLFLVAGCAHTSAGPPPLSTIDYETAEGETGTLAAAQGRVVVIDICAASQDPCLVNAKAMSDACDAFCEDGVEVVTLLLDEMGPAAVRSYKEVLGVRHRVLIAGRQVKAGESLLGEVADIPRVVIIDQDGDIVEDIIGGVLTGTQLSRRIADVL